MRSPKVTRGTASEFFGAVCRHASAAPSGSPSLATSPGSGGGAAIPIPSNDRGTGCGLVLFRRFLDFCCGRERFAAGPGMLGDVEQHAFGPVHLHLEPADPLRLALVHVVLATMRRDLRRRVVEIVDEDAEMVQPGV